MSAERRTVPTLPCDVSCFFSPSEARDFLLGAPACPSLSYMQFFIPPLPVPRVTLGDQSSKPGTEPVVSLHPGDSCRDQRSRPLRVGRLPSLLLETSSLSGRDSAPWLRSQVLRPHTVPRRRSTFRKQLDSVGKNPLRATRLRDEGRTRPAGPRRRASAACAPAAPPERPLKPLGVFRSWSEWPMAPCRRRAGKGVLGTTSFFQNRYS